MKNLLILFVIFITLSSSKPTSIGITYDLKTAIEKKLVACELTGNTDSPHYYQPLQINIKNLTDKSLQIKIPNGQKISSDSLKIQDLIITQEELIALRPKEKESKPLFAMCIQQFKSASNNETTYHLGKQTSDNLKKLTEEIEKNKSHNTLGQYSIWALTNDFPIEEIGGFDEEEAFQYQNFMADLLDITLPTNISESYKTYYSQTKTLKRSVKGMFKYKFHKQSNVTIGLFNEQDIIVRELYSNPTEKAGEHLFNYAFDTNTYEDPVYFIRLIINGEIKIDFKMEPRRT